MADGGTGEKTEEPTPEKLRKLRKEGNVPKSQDLTMGMSFVVVMGVLAASMPLMGDALAELFNTSMLAITKYDAEAGGSLSYRMLMAALWSFTKVCAPVCAAAFVMGIAMNVAQVGFMFATKPITPDLNKVNPVNGFKNLLNMKKVVESLKTVIKFTLVAYISYLALKAASRDVILIVRSDVTTGMKVIGEIVWEFCLKISGVFILIAAFDAIYQKKRYIKDNRMSKYDIKQEYKQSEGDPQQKADRKRMHQEVLNSAAPSAVKSADVVVRNPDHIAVALKYESEDGTGAPEIVAKGNRIWAERILEMAKAYGIPIVRNVPLAQALDKLEVGDEVPEELYEAVAEVLNFVFELAERQQRK